MKYLWALKGSSPRSGYACEGAVGQASTLLGVLEIPAMIWSGTCSCSQVEDQSWDLDPAVEFARHDVGRGDVDRGVGCGRP